MGPETGLMLCIDPGLRACGCALFAGRTGILLHAGLPQNPIKRERGPVAWHGMARAVLCWYVSTACSAPTHVRIEGQVVDSRTPNANDMLEVSGVAGACAALWLDAKVSSPGAPEHWKSSIDKKAMTARIQSRLDESPDELGRLDPVSADLRHNMLDAVGIGLKHFGRLEPRKVIAR